MRYKVDYSRDVLYKFYEEENKRPVERKIYAKVLKEFFEGVFDLIIKENMWFELPSGLGTIRVQEKEVKSKIVDGKLVHNMRMDFNATKQLWKNDPKAKEEKRKIYHLNEHTDGMAYRIKWDQKKIEGGAKDGLRPFWGYIFKPTPVFRRTLSSHLKDPERKTQYFK